MLHVDESFFTFERQLEIKLLNFLYVCNSIMNINKPQFKQALNLLLLGKVSVIKEIRNVLLFARNNGMRMKNIKYFMCIFTIKIYGANSSDHCILLISYMTSLPPPTLPHRPIS